MTKKPVFGRFVVPVYATFAHKRLYDNNELFRPIGMDGAGVDGDNSMAAFGVKADYVLAVFVYADGKLELICGERRLRAAKMAGLYEVPCIIMDVDMEKSGVIALIENIQRSDLNPIEEAYGYKRLMERNGMTQAEVAQSMSKGRSTVANALRLLELPEEAQQLLFEEKITAGHARAILSISDPEGRKTLTKKLASEKLSVFATK